jgi:hypothetical protein
VAFDPAIAGSIERPAAATRELKRDASGVRCGARAAGGWKSGLPMQRRPRQFSIGGLLWATFWVGLWLASAALFDWRHFLDNDPDNVVPRAVAAFWAVPIAGIVGSLCGRPLAWAMAALVIWVPVALMLLLVEILPGLI